MKERQEAAKAEPLSSPDGRVPLAHAKRAGASAGRRFAHSVEQVLEHDSVVARLVLRGIEESQALSLVGQRVKLLQIFFGLGTGQLFQVTLAEKCPVFGPGVKPLSQFVGGSKIAQPLLQGDLSF